VWVIKTGTGETSGAIIQRTMEQMKFYIGDPVNAIKQGFGGAGIVQEVDEHIQEYKIHFVDGKCGWFPQSCVNALEDCEVELQCENCEDGVAEGERFCTQPASNCCGGCYTYETCDECNGTGWITEDIGTVIDKIDKFTPIKFD
jgi:hypothetical protein